MRGRFGRSLKGALFDAPSREFPTGFRLFRLSCERPDPMRRSKPQRGGHLGAEIETPVAQAAFPLASALLLAALLAIPSSGIALAQAPPGNEIKLVNADRDFVERKGGGEFVARPVFDRQLETLFYAVRDADTGDWITAMYRVKGGEKKTFATAGNTRGSTRPSTSSRTSTATAPTSWSCWRAPRTGLGATSTPSSPSTSRGRSGTRFSPPSARRAGPKPSPAG